MYCSECGTKNEQDALFCSECGNRLEHDDNVKTNSSSNIHINLKPNKPLSKKQKIIFIASAIVLFVFGVGYKIGSDLTNPKTIAKNYVDAVINQDGNKLYNYLEISGDKTFVSKKIFSDLLKENKTDTKISNYKITDVTYGEGKLTAKVNYTYTIKDSTTERTGVVNLTKDKKKKLLLFDNWKISDNSGTAGVVSDYTIKVSKGSNVTFSDVKLVDSYLDRDKSTDTQDVYILPQVFSIKTPLKTILPSGFIIEESVTPSKYYNSHTVSFSASSVSDKQKEKIANNSKTIINDIYNSVLSKKTFNDIKETYTHGKLDLTDLETNYTSFKTSLENASNTLTAIEFTDVNIYDLSLTKEGNIKVTVKLNYNYSVQYEDYNKELKTHDDSDYSRMSIIVGYDQQKDSYYLIDINNLTTYFSKY